MTKLTLQNVLNILGNPTSAANTINENNTLIEAALENTLSRDGATPNQMAADIDMNHNDLLNVGLLQVDDLLVDGSSTEGVLSRIEESLAQVIQSANDAEQSELAAAASADEAQVYAEMVGAAVYDFSFDSDPELPGYDWSE